jgi:hypothetical protein
MRFYDRQHLHYCGIDLHVKTMYVCILGASGQVFVHRNVKATPSAFLERDGLEDERLECVLHQVGGSAHGFRGSTWLPTRTTRELL